MRFSKRHSIKIVALIGILAGAMEIVSNSVTKHEEASSMDTFFHERTADFEKRIAPFFWVEHDGKSFSLCLGVAERYKRKLFVTRSREGFRGNGYDWESLAKVFLEEKIPALEEVIKFDPEMGMFCAYSSDADALAKFAIAFKDACQDDALILDLFSRAKTDHILDDATMKKTRAEVLKWFTEEDVSKALRKEGEDKTGSRKE